MEVDQIAYILSTLSIIFYSIVYIPQFLIIYQAKSSKGISLWMLLMWTQADIVSLIGSILLFMPLSLIIMSWYHVFMGFSMIVFVLHYSTRNETLIYKYVAATVFILINTAVCITLQVYLKEPHLDVGVILGWITMSLYILGRLPQIHMNYTRQSTEGLSILMYVFTMCGNILYTSILLLYPESLVTNMPWIVTEVCIVFLDIVILIQYFVYKPIWETESEITINDVEYYGSV